VSGTARRLLLEMLEFRTLLAVDFVVMNTDDSGSGSLRQAILDSNASSGPDAIVFNIPGAGPHTIRPTSELPVVTDPIVIDGYSQPGSSENTLGIGPDSPGHVLGDGHNGVLNIELDGSLAGPFANGLVLAGGSSTIRGLVINQWDGNGLVLSGDGNTVAGNFIGTDLSGTVARPNATGGDPISWDWSSLAGIDVRSGNNTIGGITPADRNLVSGNGGNGISVGGWYLPYQPTNNRIVGNLVGTDRTGTLPLGNASAGIVASHSWSDLFVGGSTPAERNIVAATTGTRSFIFDNWETGGILALDGSNATIQGNFVGTDVTGTQPLGNVTYGVAVGFVANALIGGTEPGEGNLVADSSYMGMFLHSGTGYFVRGNTLGTNLAGTAALGEQSVGIFVHDCDVTIGGTDAGAGNLISGSSGVGLAIQVSDGPIVQGNRIGTDRAGTTSIGNAVGIDLANGVSGAVIGGAAPGAGNLVSGNQYHGILLKHSDVGGNVIQGNRIGTDLSGTSAVPNGLTGVVLYEGTHDNKVGGALPGEGNLISGNSEFGIVVSNASSNTIEGNSIGTDVTGTFAIGNLLGGVILGSSSGTRIGSNIDGLDDAAEANRIAHNGGTGVAIIDGGTGNSIRGNAIESNGGPGIDLGWDGVTPNDPGDTDTGDNALQNFPVLQSARTGGQTRVTGSLGSNPATAYVIDFYANETADPLGYGEGSRYLGSIDVTTDGSGNIDFDAVLAAPVAVGEWITATATERTTGNTSEFSAASDAIPNVAPTITSFASNHPDVCASSSDGWVTISGSLTDPDSDSHTVIIDWGDGTTDSASVNQLDDTFSGGHHYAGGGIYTVTATAFDGDGNESAPVLTMGVVQGVGLVGGSLYVIGTPSADRVTVHAQGNGRLKVHADFLQGGPFVTFSAADVEILLAYLCGGDDRMTVNGNVGVQAILQGGDGDDRLIAGGGPTVLLGGGGNDELLGGGANDILIGGLGRDRLSGGRGDDALLGGSASNEDDVDALLAALAVWASSDDYATRVAAMDAIFSVADDEDEDELTGGAGRDLFFGGLGDRLRDRATGCNPETVL